MTETGAKQERSRGDQINNSTSTRKSLRLPDLKLDLRHFATPIRRPPKTIGIIFFRLLAITSRVAFYNATASSVVVCRTRL
jgi:hypothetical protein